MSVDRRLNFIDSVELGMYLNLLSITHPATLRVRHSLAWPFGFNIVVLVGDYLSSYADERSDPTLHPCNTLRPHAGGIGGIFGVVLDKCRALDASMLCALFLPGTIVVECLSTDYIYSSLSHTGWLIDPLLDQALVDDDPSLVPARYYFAPRIPAPLIEPSIYRTPRMRLPPELREEADILSIEENPSNGFEMLTGTILESRGDALALAVPVGSKWREARVLRVKILNGTRKIKAKIRQYANAWTAHADITFDFVDSGDAEIRINIDSSGNSWSYVGTENLSIPKTRPTMNFGWLTDASSEAEFSSAIIHEFGHVLGCVHKHPECPVVITSINMQALYEYVRGAKNSFHVLAFNTMELGPSDKPEKEACRRIPFPITYDSPPKLVVGLNHLNIGKDTDIRIKAFADNITPSSADIHLDTWQDTTVYAAGCAWMPIPPDDPDFQVGEFSTQKNDPRQNPQRKTSSWVAFERAYVSPPKVVVCLTRLDIATGRNWRVTTTATHVTTRGFLLHLDTWSDTLLHAATAAWIAYPSDRPGMVSGSFNTQDVRPAHEPQMYNSGRVFFPCDAFRRAPSAVFLAFNSLDVNAARNLRLKLRMESLSDDGLSWHIDSWYDTILHSAGASYIAFA